MFINFVDAVGKKVASIEIGYLERGIQIPLDDLQEGSYSIEFQNNGDQGKSIRLIGGVVIYD